MGDNNLDFNFGVAKGARTAKIDLWLGSVQLTGGNDFLKGDTNDDVEEGSRGGNDWMLGDNRFALNFNDGYDTSEDGRSIDIDVNINSLVMNGGEDFMSGDADQDIENGTDTAGGDDWMVGGNTLEINGGGYDDGGRPR